MTAGVTTDAIGVAVDAACQVRDAADTKAFMRAVRHFRHVLSAMPDQTLGPVSADGARRLEMLSEGVVECIEQHVTTSVQRLDAQTLAQDVYRIRALMEDVSRMQHYSTRRLAAQVLALGAASSNKAALEPFKNDPDAVVRINVAFGLARTRDDAAQA